jgi:hypothetical protein
MVTWQEVAKAAPGKLQTFLGAKYGIGAEFLPEFGSGRV